MSRPRRGVRDEGAWRCLTFSAAGARLGILAAILHENGSIGAEEREGRLLAYFAGPVDETALLAAARAGLGAEGDDVILETSTLVYDGRWHARWMRGLAPIEAGRRFLIIPGTASPEAAGGSRTGIVMVPGQAFGTGEHATTRMCLELLEECVVPGDALLDVGTGSGILAIAARMLGASSVVAIDIDPVAVEVAARNARANQVRGILFAACGLEALAPREAEVVVANLYGATIVRLMREIARRATRDTVLSGFDTGDEHAVIESAASHGLMAEARLEREGWVAVRFRRRTVGI